MAIETNLTSCGPAGGETTGAIVKDQIDQYYVITDAGTFLLPQAVAEAINAIITYPHAPVTIAAENLGDQLLILTTAAGGAGATDDVFDVYLQGRATTTDTTPTVIATIPIGGGTDIVLTFSGIITARRTGGTAGSPNDGAGYRVEFVANSTSGTAFVIGALVTDIGESDPLWTVNVDAVGGNVEISVQGAVDVNISWNLSGHWVNAVG